MRNSKHMAVFVLSDRMIYTLLGVPQTGQHRQPT